MTTPDRLTEALDEAIDEAIRLVAGAGNGTTTRSRSIEEWQRLFGVLSKAHAALATRPEPGEDGLRAAISEYFRRLDAVRATGDRDAQDELGAGVDEAEARLRAALREARR